VRTRPEHETARAEPEEIATSPPEHLDGGTTISLLHNHCYCCYYYYYCHDTAPTSVRSSRTLLVRGTAARNRRQDRACVLSIITDHRKESLSDKL
jgi:hypothetical protein